MDSVRHGWTTESAGSGIQAITKNSYLEAEFSSLWGDWPFLDENHFQKPASYPGDAILPQMKSLTCRGLFNGIVPPENFQNYVCRVLFIRKSRENGLLSVFLCRRLEYFVFWY